MRLIDADELIKSAGLFEAKMDARGCGKSILHLAKTWFFSEVSKAPTIEAVPVKHGQWEWVGNHWECTNCRGNRFHDLVLGLDAAYCGRCGAKMDGERRFGND